MNSAILPALANPGKAHPIAKTCQTEGDAARKAGPPAGQSHERFLLLKWSFSTAEPVNHIISSRKEGSKVARMESAVADAILETRSSTHFPPRWGDVNPDDALNPCSCDCPVVPSGRFSSLGWCMERPEAILNSTKHA